MVEEGEVHWSGKEKNLIPAFLFFFQYLESFQILTAIYKMFILYALKIQLLLSLARIID